MMMIAPMQKKKNVIWVLLHVRILNLNRLKMKGFLNLSAPFRAFGFNEINFLFFLRLSAICVQENFN